MDKERLLDLLVDRLAEHYRERANILQDPHRSELFHLFLQARRFDHEFTDDEVREAVSQRVDNPGPALLGVLRDFSIMWTAWQYCGECADLGLDHLLSAGAAEARMSRTSRG
ncbi:hypothetical protein SVA_2365 [Sulfurifustis variabilis]|uniref:Uncharacterized protein n=1 Tax=Sulfurifustis variabilis TaxID=1675686 RepID=A0A1B4V630_9GAMM|nr:hypothetical protein [Sulfurifustis variabilis]BAU48915.1 hypothetical protein SVA_2365 [Sulfurifustis variabilis]